MWIGNCSAVHCHFFLEHTSTCKELQAILFLFWLFLCRKCSPSLTKTNKYFIQCIMCAVWCTREKERGRPQESICFEFLMTLLLTLLALLHRGNAQGCYAMESNISFNTAFSFLFFSASLSIFRVPISLSYSHKILPPTHSQTQDTGKTEAQFWELTLAWGLFSVAVLCQK